MMTLRCFIPILSLTFMASQSLAAPGQGHANPIFDECELNISGTIERKELQAVRGAAEQLIFNSIRLALRNANATQAFESENGFQGIRTLGAYGTHSDITLLQSLASTAAPDACKHDFGAAVSRGAVAAIFRILERGKKIESTEYFEKAQVLWAQWTQPYLRLQLLRIHPELSETPKAEMILLAHEQIEGSLRLLRKNPKSYDGDRSFECDEAALEFIRDEEKNINAYLNLDAYFVWQARRLKLPLTRQEKALATLRGIKANKDISPINAVVIERPTEKVKDSKKVPRTVVYVAMTLRLPDDVLSEIDKVLYVSPNGVEREVLAPSKDRFKYLFPIEPQPAGDEIICTIIIHMKDHTKIELEGILKDLR